MLSSAATPQTGRGPTSKDLMLVCMLYWSQLGHDVQHAAPGCSMPVQTQADMLHASLRLCDGLAAASASCAAICTVCSASMPPFCAARLNLQA